MIYSNKLEDLRPDVEVNVRIWINECLKNGLDVKVSNTLRDDEYQAYLYEQGRTRDGVIVTYAKKVAWHGKGLALDFYSESTGWSNHDFFVRCAEIAKKIGFSWAGDWSRNKEFGHIQWDNHKKSHFSDTPLMPKYEEPNQPSSWAVDSWEKAISVGATDGTRPKDGLTRQELMKVLDNLNLLNGEF